jgi:hypothetical protein
MISSSKRQMPLSLTELGQRLRSSAAVFAAAMAAAVVAATYAFSFAVRRQS